MDVILGGIEGGATHSKIVLYNGQGEKLAECGGPGVNHWLFGMAECEKRINGMVEEAKAAAKLPIDKPLASLGMSLSGCEQEETNKQLEDELHELYPNLSSHYVVCSDTVGSIAAAHRHGGMVLIAGTGSNALLLNPDGTQSRCGGWGNMLGDEGSAFWVSHKAVKIYFDDEDNLAKAPYDTSIVWQTIKDHFQVSNRFDLLEHCYSKFHKPKFAALCKKLAEEAKAGDPLCLWLFEQTGRALATMVRALVPAAHKDLFLADSGLPVVCVGSVWLSWDLLKNGFVSRLQEPPQNECDQPVCELSLLKLTTSMAVGATYLAADAIGIDMPRDYRQNYTVFYHYKPQQRCECAGSCNKL
ncbi:N-acetyl-D-glucosamine kinase isoform X1 [Schistocerca piceifrons]|uniref:N-acetyl-D-glucosamine kinase isoform X1 n=2 Tax=Schistocerca piceifrons TaxID=274613 RepID=UPI001F5EAE01|nr:N-acetyl-D-glucosamine kinase isoform X1 [Schistocerca piceifrons]